MYYFDLFCGKKVLKSTMTEGYNCFFSTREFVLTPAQRDDLISESLNNRNILMKQLGVDFIYTAKQTHSSNIGKVSEGKVFYDDTDALISNIPGSVMLLNFADCTPIILYSKKDNTAAVIHAGWRGTASKIAEKTAEKMYEEYGVNPENIIALIGPAIGKCCFETHEDVFLKLVEDTSMTDLYVKKGDKYFVDLKLLNKYQLKNTGIQNIDMCDYCTCCMSDIFFSYRKEKGITARHSAVVKIKGDK